MKQKHKKLIVFTLIFSFLLLGTGVFVNNNKEVEASDGEMLTMLRGMNQVLGLIAEKLTVFNVRDGNVGIGTTSPQSKMHVSGEIVSDSWSGGHGQIRMTSDRYGDDYATILRQDSRSFYYLLTDANNPYGHWNDLRPLRIDNETGNVGIGNNNLAVLHEEGIVRIQEKFCIGNTCITEKEFKAVFGDM